MRRLTLIILLGFSILGCSQVKKFTDAQAWCAQDASCLSETKKYAEVGKQVGGSFNPIAGGIAGSVITFIGLGLLGMKRKPKTNG